MGEGYATRCLLSQISDGPGGVRKKSLIGHFVCGSREALSQSRQVRKVRCAGSQTGREVAGDEDTFGIYYSVMFVVNETISELFQCNHTKLCHELLYIPRTPKQKP